MSQRSQVANNGSSPIDACSAACAEPGRSARRQARLGQGVGRDRPPDRGGPQGPFRQVERLLADHLARRLATAQERHDLVADVDLTQATAGTRPTAVLALGDDRDVGDLPGRRRVVGLGGLDHRDALLEVERAHQPGLAAVHVHRAGVGGPVGAAGVDGADHPAGAGFDQLHRRAARWTGCRRGRTLASGRSRTIRAAGGGAVRPG